MRWQYSISLLLLVFTPTIFLTLAIFHIDTNLYYPEGSLTNPLTIGYSWIWYHFEHWVICLVLSLIATGLFIHGLFLDLQQSNWKLSNYIKIEIIEDEEP